MPVPLTAAACAAAIDRLRAAGCVFAEAEVEVLAAASADSAELTALVRRRAAGEPLEQVVGYADFCGLRIHLRPGVFVPRPRSELLVRAAVEETRARGLAAGAPLTVVDLCCGSGALGAAVAAGVAGIALHAADLDPVAVACAGQNVAPCGGQVHAGDLFDALPPALRGHVDVLLANVPYVPTAHIPLLPAEARLHEPTVALDGGADGLAVLRRVAGSASGWLAPGGVMLSEVAADQATAAIATLNAAGLTGSITTDADLDATVVLGHRRA